MCFLSSTRQWTDCLSSLSCSFFFPPGLTVPVGPELSPAILCIFFSGRISVQPSHSRPPSGYPCPQRLCTPNAILPEVFPLVRFRPCIFFFYRYRFRISVTCPNQDSILPVLTCSVMYLAYHAVFTGRFLDNLKRNDVFIQHRRSCVAYRLDTLLRTLMRILVENMYYVLKKIISL